MDADHEPARRPRRWFQYSLRTLFILVLLASLPMSWLAVRLDRARRQRAAVEAMQASGGTVSYATYYGPGAWSEVFGHDFSQDVDRIMVWTDDHLRLAKDLHGLLSVELFQDEITDDGLAHLAHQPQLLRLRFGVQPNPKITEVGLARLRSLKQLKQLEIRYIDLSSDRLKYLRELPELRELVLGRGITDADVVHLGKMTSLRRLTVLENTLSDNAISQLRSALPQCRIEQYGPLEAWFGFDM